MLVSDFDYPLPDDLIADRPAPRRTDSRLMVVSRQDRVISHHHFYELPELLSADDLLILNQSKVIPARLFGQKKGGGAKIEILLLEKVGEGLWTALAQRAIRLSAGVIVEFDGHHSCEVLEVYENGRFLFKFHISLAWEDFLERFGSAPLPPYIVRKRQGLAPEEKALLEKMDLERYQTAYASEPGSAAAPTAGLHFDAALLEHLREKGIEQACVTLHVGMDTFTPVMVDRVDEHVMKSERCYCPEATREAILRRKNGAAGRVLAVGTTSCRTIESYARAGWPSDPLRTELFLKPGDSFLAADMLLTNFHLPKSTLLMLVSAFMGNELRIKAYEEAVRARYRFYSYGDAMLIV